MNDKVIVFGDDTIVKIQEEYQKDFLRKMDLTGSVIKQG